jgi:hypothetical protein
LLNERNCWSERNSSITSSLYGSFPPRPRRRKMVSAPEPNPRHGSLIGRHAVFGAFANAAGQRASPGPLGYIVGNRKRQIYQWPLPPSRRDLGRKPERAEYRPDRETPGELRSKRYGGWSGGGRNVSLISGSGARVSNGPPSRFPSGHFGLQKIPGASRQRTRCR